MASKFAFGALSASTHHEYGRSHPLSKKCQVQKDSDGGSPGEVWGRFCRGYCSSLFFSFLARLLLVKFHKPDLRHEMNVKKTSGIMSVLVHYQTAETQSVSERPPLSNFCSPTFVILKRAKDWATSECDLRFRCTCCRWRISANKRVA